MAAELSHALSRKEQACFPEVYLFLSLKLSFMCIRREIEDTGSKENEDSLEEKNERGF